MGFQNIPTKIVFGSKSVNGYYEGIDNDSFKYLFQIDNTWVMTTSFLSFTFTDSAGTVDGLYRSGDCGGEPCYSATSGGWKIYYVPSWEKWLLIQNPPYYGYLPRASAESETDPDTLDVTHTYTGDIWWEATSFNTMPLNGATAGTFNFALSGWTSTYTNLSQYASIVHTFTGDIAGTYYRKTSSGNEPEGIYEGDRYVGFPEWRYSWNDSTQRIIKYGDNINKWVNITRYNIRSVNGRYLNTRWTGWVATATLGPPNADTTKGFYATLTEPNPTESFVLHWFHFVPDDPDDPDSDGDIVQESSWTDEQDVVHENPDISVSWDGIKTRYGTHVNKLRLLAKIDVGEAAIWR